jgi:hypothetical protein
VTRDTVLTLSCETALRRLVCAGYAEHRREVTTATHKRRAFRPEGRLSFGEHTCFVLTEPGVASPWTS